VQRPAILPLIASESNPPLYWLMLKASALFSGTDPKPSVRCRRLQRGIGRGSYLVRLVRVNRRFAARGGPFLALSRIRVYYMRQGELPTM